MGELQRYRSFVADNARWDGFRFRPGDIVISTPPKSGTTWTQMMVALLVFDGPDFPDILDRISPWLDMNTRSVPEVHGLLDAQTHRRFVKTHTPLDGLPRHDDVHYLVVGRDPRDAWVSMLHHMDNMDFERFFEARAQAVGVDDLDELMSQETFEEDPATRFHHFVVDDGARGVTLSGILHHLDTGWQRRDDDNVGLFHYADYRRDPAGELMRLGAFLDLPVDPQRAADLAAEATLDRMRSRADQVVPDREHDHWKDPARFFRSGGSGEWRDIAAPDDVARYDERVAELVEPALATWAHEGWRRAGT